MTVHVRARPLLTVVFATVALLVLAGGPAGLAAARGAGGLAGVLAPLFDLGAENNVPTWSSTALLLGTALVLAASALREPEPASRRRWLAIALIVAGVSFAEDSSVLERAIVFTSSLPDPRPARIFWPLAGRVGAALALLAFAPVLRREPRRRAALFVTAAVIALLGHAGFSWLGGALARSRPGHVRAIVAARVGEEGCKLSGTALGFAAALRRLRAQGPLRIEVG